MAGFRHRRVSHKGDAHGAGITKVKRGDGCLTQTARPAKTLKPLPEQGFRVVGVRRLELRTSSVSKRSGGVCTIEF